MKIAFTADLHLTDREENPERHESLKNILDQCTQLEINHLIIAGDLFDSDLNNLAEFEKIVNSRKYSDFNIHVIPGNHDTGLTEKKLSVENIKVHSEPEWILLDDDWKYLLIPYQNKRTMGEVLEEKIGAGKPKKWVLIGHGDCFSGMAKPNTKAYMPLTNKDLTLYQPDFVFLGHIHKLLMGPQVFYPGSPCAVDTTETGYRHFLVFDSEKQVVEKVRVETGILYFDEELLIYPIENEEENLIKRIKELINSWGVDPGDMKKINLRLKIKGYSNDRSHLAAIIRESFSGIHIRNDIDLSEVSFGRDPEKTFLFKKALAEIESLELNGYQKRPLKNQIIFETMRLIFGD